MTQSKNLATRQTVDAAPRADHVELGSLFERVKSRLQSDDPERIRARWIQLEDALERHLTGGGGADASRARAHLP